MTQPDQHPYHHHTYTADGTVRCPRGWVRCTNGRWIELRPPLKMPDPAQQTQHTITAR